MIVFATALLVATAAAGPADTLLRGGSVGVPPSISQEVQPYGACLLDRYGKNPHIRSREAAVFEAVKAAAKSACAQARRDAAAKADGKLKEQRQYRDAARRQAAIEEALARTESGLVMLYLATAPAPADAPLSVEQALIVYDQCLARAAAAASRTDAADTEIYPIARAACAEVRAGLAAGEGADSERIRALDAVDAERAASFPERTRQLREMRRKREAGDKEGL